MIQSDLTYYAHQLFDDCDKEIDDSQNMNYLQVLNCQYFGKFLPKN